MEKTKTQEVNLTYELLQSREQIKYPESVEGPPIVHELIMTTDSLILWTGTVTSQV